MPGTGGDEAATDGAGTLVYAYHEGPASWSEAREACQASGGDLAMPRNAADDASAFQVARGKLAYIGLSDRASEGSFVWADGEPVGSYTHWASGEPNSFAGSNEDCAAYHFYFESGQWADISCSGVDPNDGDRPIGYVCEVSHMPCPAPPFAHALLHTSLRFLLGQEPRTNGRQRQRRLEPAYGPIELSGSCGGFNCFDGAHINGHDITCETDVSEADCVATCCAQADCKGFDYSASDHGMGAGRCCTGHVSRVEGGFEKNGGTYRSCEKNSVTDASSGSTFIFHAERKSWHAARDACRAAGGDLASIHSAAENDEAYALGLNGEERWLGLNGEEREDVWVWSDGSPMDYDGWAPGEPNNYGGDEDCGGYWSGRAAESPEKPKGWDSLGGGASCSAEYPFICRGGSAPSKGGFTYHSSPKSWEAARADCMARGGDLASIHSAAENQQAFELSRGGNMWLGLNDRAAEGKWKWSDGTPMDYKRWSESGADSWGGDEDCAGFWEGRGDGSWDDMYGEASCSQPLPYLCGKKSSGRCKARASEVEADQVSAGAIAGIVVGVVLALAAVVGFLCLVRLKKRNVGGAPVQAQRPPTSTATPNPGSVQMQGTVAQPVVATVVPVATAAYPSASDVLATPAYPMGTAVAGGSASMPLAEMVEILKREIGLDGTMQSVVQGAAQQLGVAHEGQTLMQTAQLCLQKLGHRS